MADSAVDFSSIDDSASYMVPLGDPGVTADSTDPFAVAPDPGLFGSVGPQPMVSDGQATADTLSSTDGISTTANTDSNWADGSSAVGLSGDNPTFWDSQGNILQGTQDADGYWHLSDGSIIDPLTGNKWNSDGNTAPVDASAPGAPASGGSGGFAPVTMPKGGGGGPSAAKQAQDNTILSKALGSLGASLSALLGRPQNPTPQQLARNRATIAGQPSNLSGFGSGVFVVGSLALIFLLVKGR